MCSGSAIQMPSLSPPLFYFHFSPPYTHTHTHTECTDLIKALLTLDPTQRLDSAGILKSEWLRMEPIKTPISIVPASQGAKYTPANTLPPNFHLYKPPHAYEGVLPRPIQVRPATPMPSSCGVNAYVVSGPVPALNPVGLVPDATTAIPSLTHPHRGVVAAGTPTPSSPGTVLPRQPTPAHLTTPHAGRSPRLVSRIGACGRRIADAVKHVGQHSHHNTRRRSQRAVRGSHLPERPTT